MLKGIACGNCLRVEIITGCLSIDGSRQQVSGKLEIDMVPGEDVGLEGRSRSWRGRWVGAGCGWMKYVGSTDERRDAYGRR